MSIWSHYPEELNELTLTHLPKEWSTQVRNEAIELSDIPFNILCPAMQSAEEDFMQRRCRPS